MLFVLSAEYISNACWYVLNQSDLDRGPAVSMPSDFCEWPGNTWGCNNSGEFDFLEPACAGDPLPTASDYLKAYSTGMSPSNLGQYGRCLFWSEGMYGGHSGGGGWYPPSKYFLLDDSDTSPGDFPRTFVGVVDQLGMRTYRIPTAASSPVYWLGIGRKEAAMELAPGPISPVASSPCHDRSALCATFNPFCPKEAQSPEDYAAIQSMADGADRGFCGNWAHEKLVALGPASLWGTATKPLGTRGQVMGSWNADMESAPEGSL